MFYNFAAAKLLTYLGSDSILPLVLQRLFSGGRFLLLTCPVLPPEPKESQVNLIGLPNT
jgi:hypothetical protein